jgi:hypothetical protein
VLPVPVGVTVLPMVTVPKEVIVPVAVRNEGTKMEAETIDLETVLKAHVESSQNIAKLLAIIAQKLVGFEKLFNKDLFKQGEYIVV